MGHMSESEVIEARVRLVVGLKRYFHGKRVEGLLSTAVSSRICMAFDSTVILPKLSCLDMYLSSKVSP